MMSGKWTTLTLAEDMKPRLKNGVEKSTYGKQDKLERQRQRARDRVSECVCFLKTYLKIH